MASAKSTRSRLALAAILALAATAAGAQENLDAGKSAPRLFAESCATCHRSARGLAKGRFTLTLYMHLQQHYASNSSSAWALASYLNSLDGAKGSPKRAARTSQSGSTWTARSSLRPPMPVPTR